MNLTEFQCPNFIEDGLTNNTVQYNIRILYSYKIIALLWVPVHA